MLGFFFFFFNDTATTEIYTLSLHDALPICPFLFAPAPPLFILLISHCGSAPAFYTAHFSLRQRPAFYTANFSLRQRDRKSTRLNSSHRCISYAVFCLKKKKRKQSDMMTCGHPPPHNITSQPSRSAVGMCKEDAVNKTT